MNVNGIPVSTSLVILMSKSDKSLFLDKVLVCGLGINDISSNNKKEGCYTGGRTDKQTDFQIIKIIICPKDEEARKDKRFDEHQTSQ